ncbi:hypothetical protein [Streptosporangium roseum]|uniref:hypothetical protein n=1 Tax=Streptosporangium roseum TaxID=2001 RepID=UPI0012DDE554|nr:hypothetical protein [Streptosporangium roseum]
MWTAIRENDGSLLVPIHVVTPEGWYGDGATRLHPSDPGYAQYELDAVASADLQPDSVEDERLIARWEAQQTSAERRSA